MHLLAHEESAVGFLDAETRDIVECGRTKRLAGPETETRVMPRTVNCITYNDAVSERTAVVSACCTDGVRHAFHPRNEYGLLLNMPGQH